MYGRDNTPAAVVAAMSPVRQTLFRGVVRTVAVGETVILLTLSLHKGDMLNGCALAVQWARHDNTFYDESNRASSKL